MIHTDFVGWCLIAFGLYNAVGVLWDLVFGPCLPRVFGFRHPERYGPKWRGKTWTRPEVMR